MTDTPRETEYFKFTRADGTLVFVLYVRGDIAEEMLAALKGMDRLADEIKSFTNLTTSDDEAHAACRAAIAKAKEAKALIRPEV